MIELFESKQMIPERHSSKGNQLKWNKNGIWYKADFTGYEGLAEYVISKLLAFSTLEKNEFVEYAPEEIKYGNKILNGVSSRNFITEGAQLITLERLYKNAKGVSLYKTMWQIPDVKDRLAFLVRQIECITGIERFGQYLAKVITIDALFKNEDRHLHNIAVVMNKDRSFSLCPIFDNAAGLLSDTALEYPLNGDVYRLMDSVKAKTISGDFDEQLDAAEELYGRQIKFNFTRQDVDRIVDAAAIYTKEERERVKTVIYQQIRKYEYLFE